MKQGKAGQERSITELWKYLCVLEVVFEQKARIPFAGGSHPCVFAGHH